MSLYSQIAEQIVYIAPQFFKKRFFKKLIDLSPELVKSRNIEPELYWLRKILKKDAIALDIGSNVGAYLFVLEGLLPAQSVFGFEPNPKLHNRLQKIYPKIHISRVALSDCNGELVFKIPIIKGEKVHSRGTLQTQMKEENEENSEIQKVKVQTLDYWLENEKITRLDFVKIDVEGNEMKTLFGAKKSLQTYQPILMVEMEQRHHQKSLWNLVSELESWGFKAHYLSRIDFELKELTQVFLEKQSQNQHKNHWEYINNIIFKPL